jgi:hypothetical protein
MRANEFIIESISSYINQIPALQWKPVSKFVWTAIQDEGLDEEQDAFEPENWSMATLQITPEDVKGLKSFNDDVVNRFNSFDIALKDRYPGLVDLIDYDRGVVIIVKNNLMINEAPLQSYDTFGDFNKPGPFRGPDKKLVPHPTNILKTQRFLEQTPYDFRLFFSNIPGTGKYSEYGPMDANQLKQIFGDQADQIINGSDDAITVVFVGNKGDAKVPLTPWIMAHRFGHAIQAGVRKNRQWSAWGEAEKHFFSQVNQMLEEYYGKIAQRGYGTSASMKTDLTPEYNALFNAIGTQRSSRSGDIKRPYEFLYELFAQYLGTGKITLNPLPTNLGYGRKAWGTPTRYLNIKPEYRDEAERREATDVLGRDMEIMFSDVLDHSVGTIFVM